MDPHSLEARVRAHLGDSAPHVVHRTFPEWQAADVSIACQEFWQERGAEVVHLAGDPAALSDATRGDTPVAPPALEQIEVPGGPSRHGVRAGLAFADVDGAPVVVACRWRREPPQRYELTALGPDVGAAQRLLDALAAFAERSRPTTSSLLARVAEALNTRLRAHFGADVAPAVVVHAFPEYQIADAAIQAAEFFAIHGAEFTGVGPQRGLLRTRLDGFPDPTALLRPATIDGIGQFDGWDQTAPAFERFDVEGASSRLGLREGVALLRFEGEPMFAYCGRQDLGTPEYRVTVVARDATSAQRLLDALLEHERRHSIFRGRLIRPEIDYGDRVTHAEILPFAEVGWADVVLPDRLRRSIERDVLEYARAADALEANGVAPTRSVLFHGAPGTGKTFVCRLLASELRGFTSVLVTGDSLAHPQAAFALARRFAPSLLLFEDVDLMAKDRDATAFPTALAALLNELDGVSARERVYTIFTTNRLDVLEEALARRPGRVDTILAFPPPTAELRRRLIRRHAGRAGVRPADVDWVVDRTDGATPAFLRELVKEAIFTAIRAGAVDERGIALVTRAHLADALARFEALRDEHGAERMLGFRA